MNTLLILLTFQGLLGGFDTLYHHELKERLPWKKSASQELRIHSIRNGFYFTIFISVAWLHWHGWLAWVFFAILIVEVILTLWDFVVEDRTRTLPASERITHTLLAVNYGCILAFFVPLIFNWSQQTFGLALVNYGVGSWIMTFYAFAVALWAVRDWISSQNNQNASRPLPKITLSKGSSKILITGGTGFIGSRLCQCLIDEGHEVSIITRDKSKAAKKFQGKLTLIDTIGQVTDDYDIIINLAGESISRRWTKKRKAELLNSRLNTTEQLIHLIKNAKKKPELLISASAIGFYGSSETVVFDETTQPADNDFAHNLCQKWEEKALQAEQYGTRVVLLRLGIVLGRDGGALAQMLFPFEFFLGGKIGTGQQWMSWVHIDDVLRLIAYVIDNKETEGAINVVTPNPETNEVFCQTLAKVLNRPCWLPLPAFQLKFLFGEMGEALLLKGQKVIPKKAIANGFEFDYPELEGALKNLISTIN